MKKLASWSARTWFLLVSAVAILARLGLWAVYPLTSNNDSPTYQQLARNILIKGFTTYNATRTPGYPTFLALSGDWTYQAQLVLGILSTWLFFYIGWKLSGRPWFGALAALLHSLNLGQLFFEATLLTETLTTCLVTAAFAASLASFSSNARFSRRVFFALLAGLAAALAGMVRPLFAFLPVLLAFFYFFFVTTSLRQRLLLAFIAGLPALLIFGWWLNFVNVNYKILSFDTIGGYRWLNHTGEYFEYVPDEYATIRDTYLKYRDAKIAATGSQANAIWDAMNELRKNSKMGFYALSRELTYISMNLIREHPWLYLKNVISGWWMFWWAAVYWSPEALTRPGLASVVHVAILFERTGMLIGNLILIGASLTLLAWKRSRTALHMNWFLWLVLASIWATSLAQTVMDHGDNPRYLVPLQSLLLVIVAWWIYQILVTWKINKK